MGKANKQKRNSNNIKWNQKKINLNINISAYIVQLYKKVTNLFICLAQMNNQAIFV